MTLDGAWAHGALETAAQYAAVGLAILTRRRARPHVLPSRQGPLGALRGLGRWPTGCGVACPRRPACPPGSMRPAPTTSTSGAGAVRDAWARTARGASPTLPGTSGSRMAGCRRPSPSLARPEPSGRRSAARPSSRSPAVFACCGRRQPAQACGPSPATRTTTDVTGPGLSIVALEHAQRGLGAAAGGVRWVAPDLLRRRPARLYALYDPCGGWVP